LDLNLPILHLLENVDRILVAGAGGGFDVFCGLPIYFTLRDQGKDVYLANLTFSIYDLVPHWVETLQTFPESENVVGVSGTVQHITPYFPEGYLAQWLQEHYDEPVTVYMFNKLGGIPLRVAYKALTETLGIEAIVLVDGGIDSLMRGDEYRTGTIVEDSLSILSACQTEVPIKILSTIGFGTEVEEDIAHHQALENMAALIKADGFLGSCSLIKQMSAFQRYEEAARYVFEQPSHVKSRINTRIIPAVHGEFGDVRMYDEGNPDVLLSPMMAIYWFWDANVVYDHSLIIEDLAATWTFQHAVHATMTVRRQHSPRPHKFLPY
jgi:hypothetical protein